MSSSAYRVPALHCTALGITLIATLGTNTYLVGTGHDRILIDTGEGRPEWLASLKEAVSAESTNISTVILTHWHHDHISGVPDLLSLFPQAQIYKNNPALKGDPSVWKDIQDGQRFIVDGAVLRALHCPGHTADHMALILEDEDAMFTGDNVLGHGTAVFEDLATYMASLETMASNVTGRAYPGHGDVIEDGKGRILQYISHRKQREDQVLEVLAQAKKGQVKADGVGISSMEIVKTIYVDVPVNLHEAAERGVVQILQKLASERKAEDVQGGRWQAASSNANL